MLVDRREGLVTAGQEVVVAVVEVEACAGSCRWACLLARSYMELVLQVSFHLSDQHRRPTWLLEHWGQIPLRILVEL